MQAFGSTRRKRQLEQKEGAKVGDDNVLAMDAVEDVLAAASNKAALEKMTKVMWSALVCADCLYMLDGCVGHVEDCSEFGCTIFIYCGRF